MSFAKHLKASETPFRNYVFDEQLLLNWQSETGDTDPKHITPDWYDRENGKELPVKGTRGEMPGKGKNAHKLNVKGPF